ncbi:sarcosine oxidase subunit gamma [Hansschlegelia quercus]|uniref:Sarcosine oxidase subunit gamma n=1 Tax=Hansschlegelia quercus TaxID=2528245 RepID=A0A4Q9GG29_9HYPH|nr:sarcosine oxidase subunit gamma family protein [Hansschlegelia quercus]TBN47331.1 sarcosine oxidase subunit gamma [Hansschlegelia quercus]
MLEARNLARRVAPLVAEAPVVLERASVHTLPAHARFSLRARDVSGVETLDHPIGRTWLSEKRFAARLGPDEWLLGAPESDGDLLQQGIERALSSRFFSLVDISHRNVAIEISGPAAAEALNAGCPLDLSEAAFPNGSATRTLLGKAEIVLARPSAAPVYRVECWRSFATYAHGFLIEAASSASFR